MASRYPLIGLLLLSALLGCGPSTESSVTPVPSAARAPDPPDALQLSMSSRNAEFVPLSDEEIDQVLVTAAAAVDAARAAGASHQPPLTDTGFVYLGRWTPPPQSLGHATIPPPTAAYVVQLVGASTSEPSEQESAFVVVDAATGVAVVLFDGCVGAECSPALRTGFGLRD